MKILFLTQRFWPEIGGVEKHCLEIAKQLIKKNHYVVVVTEALPQISNFQFLISSKTNQAPLISKQIPNPKHQIPNREKIEEIEVQRIPITTSEGLKKFQIWWWLWGNRNLIKEADIIHAHDVGFWYWPFRMLYPSKPFFITFHGWEGKFPVPLRNKIVRKISEKMAKGNICVGDYIKKWYGTKTSHTTYGGVAFKVQGSRQRRGSLASLKLWRSGPKAARFKVKRKSKTIVFIGRLEKDTGLPIYLQAFGLLNITYHLFFLGDGPLRHEAERYGQVLGFVKNIRPYILKSRFIFTSGYLSILEAMTCKRLVFAVYNNPLKENYLKMAPFAKWIVIESTPEALFNRLKYYFEHPEKEKKLIDQAYDWAQKQSWEKVVGLYLRLWQNYLAI